MKLATGLLHRLLHIASMLRCLATGLAEAAGVGRNLDAATKTRFSVALGGAASISTTPDLLTGLELKAVKDLQGMLQGDGANPPSSSRVPGDGLGDQTEYNQVLQLFSLQVN